jgi:ribosomal protein S25
VNGPQEERGKVEDRRKWDKKKRQAKERKIVTIVSKLLHELL